MSPQKTCFVIQGFGKKTDLASGRDLDLDASYAVIKEAVEAAGLRCIRADEIIHSKIIDVPMYEWLFRADLVIADLSTSNLNAVYELGVRYGLRPHATIIVAEEGFKYPFDVSHIAISRYKHLGEDIGVKESRRFKADLSKAILEIIEKVEDDSPVYTFLPLSPPTERVAMSPPPPVPPDAIGTAVPEPGRNSQDLLQEARAAMSAEPPQFARAVELFSAVRLLRPHDDYVVQQLALATYKSKQPDALQALQTAREYLLTLKPETTNDPETLGLWGAVHKRLWELKSDRAMLDIAIEAYQRGFYLKQDYYNGINLAYLLNVRADLERQAGAAADAVADFVLARRVRQQVMGYCQPALAAAAPGSEQRYWVVATLWEAAVGLEDAAATARWKREAEAMQAAGWMLASTREQLARLALLLAASPLKG